MLKNPISPTFRHGATFFRSALLAGLAFGAAEAATLNVNTTITTPNSGDGLCGLREAIQAVNTRKATGGCPAGDGTSDAIALPAGTYAVSAELVINKSVKIICNGPGACILDVGSFTGALVRMSGVAAGEPSLLLQKVTLRQPDGNTNNVTGIIAESGILNLMVSVVTGFEARGVSLRGAAAAYIQQCTISNNFGYGIAMESSGEIEVAASAMTGNGYGIYIGSGLVKSQGNTISNNQLGVLVSNGILHDGTDVLAGSTISNSVGVGIHAGYGSSITLKNTTVSGNLDRGISAYEGSNVNLWYCTIDGNRTAGHGGGMQILGTTTPNVLSAFMEVHSSTISNNTAGLNGGGLFVSGPVKIYATTVSQNAAGQSGGGLYHLSGDDAQTNAYFSSLNSTFAFNRATVEGGGVYQVMGANRCDFYMSIVAGNTAGSNPDVSSGFISSLQTLWGFDTGFNGTHSNDILGDPLLGPLMDNAGPHRVKTHALLKGSKAIDRFTDNPDPKGDARGFPRPPSGGLWDLGAYEVGPFETELLTVIGKSSDQHTLQSESGLGNGGGTVLWANAVGDFVTYAVAIPEPGDYDITVRIKAGPNRPIVELASSPEDGVYKPVDTLDLYRSGLAYLSRPKATFTFTSTGIKHFRFRVIGQNPGSSGFLCFYDRIVISKQ